MNNYTYLKELWEWNAKNCLDTEMQARIRGVNVYMKTFDYVNGVYLGELILRNSDNLSKTLQSLPLAAVQGQDCANTRVRVLETLRNENNFNLFWDNVTAKAESFEVDEPKLPRKRGATKDLENFYGFGPAKPAHPDEPKDLYRKHYYEALDHVISCIKERSSQEEFQKYVMLQEVLQKGARKQSFNVELEQVMKFYQSDFDVSLLKTQLNVFEEDIPEITDLNFTDVVKYLNSLHPGTKQLLSEVFSLAKLIMVCPATDPLSKRSFSALRRAKTYLQNTIKQVRLNNIMMLHVHKDRTDALNLVDVANDFIDGLEYRLSLLGN